MGGCKVRRLQAVGERRDQSRKSTARALGSRSGWHRNGSGQRRVGVGDEVAEDAGVAERMSAFCRYWRQVRFEADGAKRVVVRGEQHVHEEDFVKGRRQRGLLLGGGQKLAS